MNRRAARESGDRHEKGSASRGRKSQFGGTAAGGVTDIITRQSHLPQNCKSFIRHNDLRAITSRATYGRGFVTAGLANGYIASRKTNCPDF